MTEWDFTEFFEKYEAISREADRAFEAVRKAHPDCVRCAEGCSDCCFALFDLSLVEALYVHHHFGRRFEGDARQRILDKADAADRRTYQIKREAFLAAQKGRDMEEILSRVAWEKVRCPLLNDNERCDLYPYRPITCRLYGIPTAIGGKGHTCGRSGFEEGNPYPTVHMESLQKRLFLLSQELVERLGSKHHKLAEVLVPLSMALLTNYDREYLGLEQEKS